MGRFLTCGRTRKLRALDVGDVRERGTPHVDIVRVRLLAPAADMSGTVRLERLIRHDDAIYLRDDRRGAIADASGDARRACSARLRPACAGWQLEPDRPRRAGAGRHCRTPAAIALRSASARTNLRVRHGPSGGGRFSSDAGDSPRGPSAGARSPRAACHAVVSSHEGATSLWSPPAAWTCGRRYRQLVRAGVSVMTTGFGSESGKPAVMRKFL